MPCRGLFLDAVRLRGEIGIVGVGVALMAYVSHMSNGLAHSRPRIAVFASM
jgi:hypothetical protein